MKHLLTYNYDKNGSEYFCHESSQQIKPTAPTYRNEWNED
jgi:hypothetical protein